MSDVTKTCRDVSQLTKSAQTACNLFMAECKKQGLNVLITETYRSQERQNYLYEQGRTRPGNKVTWTKNSRHTSRRAWDICKNVKGKEYSDSKFFKQCGEIAKKLGITWGGTWSTPDTPHFEISENWKSPKKEAKIMLESGNDIIWELMNGKYKIEITEVDRAVKALDKAKRNSEFSSLYWILYKLVNGNG